MVIPFVIILPYVEWILTPGTMLKISITSDGDLDVLYDFRNMQHETVQILTQIAGVLIAKYLDKPDDFESYLDSFDGVLSIDFSSVKLGYDPSYIEFRLNEG